ncbi:DUF4097 family beta strand repeat protein [candidate division KSB1 bacterium]|nr:DUF4097 family beta strand repeat protein [candidate division KSB1 bacterium]
MKTKTFVGLMILLAACCVSAQDNDENDNTQETTLEQRFQIQPGGSLVLRDIVGDVDIESWNKNEIFVSEDITVNVFTQDEAQTIFKRLKDNYKQEGNTVRITGLGEKAGYESDFTIRVPEKINIDLKSRGGDINLTSVDGEILLQCSGGDVECQDLSGNMNINTSGGDLTFDKISGKLSANTSGGDIDLEEIYAQASVSTSGGDISLTRATNNISLKTSGGDISVERCEGRLDAVTTGGDIDITDCSGETIGVRTSGGDISFERLNGRINANTTGGDISGSGIKGRISAATQGGDIDLEDVSGAVEATTMGGDIDVRITLQDFSQPHDARISTTAGDITITLPEKIPATIKAEIFTSGNHSDWERNDIYSEFPLTKSMPDETDGHIIRSTGDINGGGDEIQLRANRGDIHIIKLK